MSDRRKEMAEEKVGKLLFRYSVPAIFAMVVNSTYNLVDTIFVGQGVGHLALAAMAVTFPVQMILLALAQVIGIGSASIISRSLGAGNIRKAQRVAGAAFADVILLALAATFFGRLFLHPLLRSFGATDIVLPYAMDYLNIILGGAIFFMFAVSTNNIVRAEGNAKVAMISMMIGALLNILLDPLFIFLFKMGIRGAAIATVISNFSSVVFLVGYLLKGKTLLKPPVSFIKPDMTTLSEMIFVGLPSFTRVVGGSLFVIVLNHSVIYYGSEIYLAITGVSHRVLQFLFLPLIGLVQGLQPIIGFNYGANNPARVKEAFWKGVSVSTIFSICGYIAIMLFPDFIFRLFNKDVTLISEGTYILRIIGFMLPLIGFQTVGAAFFQAIGKGLPALLLSMARQLLFLVPLILLLPLFYKLMGIWLAFPCSDVLATIVTGGCVLREMYYLKQIKPQPHHEPIMIS